MDTENLLTEHTSKQFDVEIEMIRSDVLAMGGLVEQQFARALQMLGANEDIEFLTTVKMREKEINQKQVTIDHQCAQIIVKRQPAAIDLRTVLTISKVVNDLERIGDEAKKIAYKATRLQGNDRQARMRHFEVVHAGALAGRMLKRILNTFARLDVDEAVAVYDADEEIDLAFDVIMRQLIGFMMEDPRTISSGLDVLFVAKSIERVGDHSKNIAEAVVQIVKGKDVRHASLEEIRAELEQD